MPQVQRVVGSIPQEGFLINGYGPTENTTFTCCHVMGCGSEVEVTVPIGRPISNTRVYLLGEYGQPVPVGVVGEMYTGGAGLARGYHRRPALTAEHFVPDPFNEQPGSRLYRTGDLARWRADGTIEFVGRRDHQVKVRGHRIELGEIETVLGRIDEVQECMAVVREDVPGNKHIVCYIVLKEGRKVVSSALRASLGRELPEYMLPTRLIQLDALPFSPSGKVDRLALPVPNREGHHIESEYVPPQTDTEHQIAAIWQEVLGVERVGIHDNFFELGGNSLLSTTVVDRIRRASRADLLLRELFQAPTVAGLAGLILPDGSTEVARRRYESVSDTSLVPLQPGGSRTPLFLVSGAHEREEDFLRFVGSILPHMGSDQPIYGFKARGLDGRSAPHRSASEMAADYIQEMREVQAEGPYLLAGNCVGGLVAFEMAQQLVQQGQKVALVALLDTPCPTDAYRRAIARHYSFWSVERVKRHWRELRELSIGGKLTYLGGKVSKKARRSLPLSESARRKNNIERVEERYAKVLARYIPRPYRGKLTLIINEEYHARELEAGWVRIAQGGLNTHVVPGDHVTRLTVYGDECARVLKADIEEALEASAGT